jgi:CheY-like chemotaxis protein
MANARIAYALFTAQGLTLLERFSPSAFLAMGGRRHGMSEGRVLVVDDESQIRRVMRTTLSSSGYEVSEATNGDEALGLIRSSDYDLVLLDVNMPGKSGLETCREIRAVGSHPAIIMVTVRDSETDKVDALDAGADGYVTKPFGIAELLARVRAVLRRTVDSPPYPAAHLRLGLVDIDFEGRYVLLAIFECGLLRKSWICFLIWPRIRIERSPIANSCRRCGGQNTGTTRNTCTFL